MTPNIVLWIYIVLLVAGGVMGLVKGKSKISLFTSVGFAALLSLCAMRVITLAHAADYILIFLLLFFGMRLAKSRKFMPMGMMAIATIATLALRYVL